MDFKVCTKCEEKKLFAAFSKNKRYKDGLRSNCKDCVKKHYQTHRVEILKQNKKYRQTHKVELAKRKKKYNQTHRIEKAKYNKEYRKKNRSKLDEYNKQWKKENTNKDYNRQVMLKHKYGVTLEQYDQMYMKQNGVCAICGGINENSQRLHVDHNHETGKVRGLLCMRCNLNLAVIENKDFIVKAKQYLKG